jgi:predicted nucleic acid-binding protein
MTYLVDTNILTRLVDPTHAMHQDALDAVTLLIRQAHTLHIVSQNLYEFWVVATRPANVNGLGKTAAQALADLVYLEGLFLWLDETVPIYSVWRDLVTSTPILGMNAHDARFVAAMTVHGLTHLLTFNIQDFRQYPGITAVSPAEILTSGPTVAGAISP